MAAASLIKTAERLVNAIGERLILEYGESWSQPAYQIGHCRMRFRDDVQDKE